MNIYRVLVEETTRGGFFFLGGEGSST